MTSTQWDEIVHDILITTDLRRPGYLWKTVLALREAINHCKNHWAVPEFFRVMVHIDAGSPITDDAGLDALKRLQLFADHIFINARTRTGITHAVNQWVSSLDARQRYYGGHSVRTDQQQAESPEICTLLQDDVVIEPWLLTYITRHQDELFGHAPWISGYLPQEHALIRTPRIGGRDVQVRSMACAVHLTATWNTWCAVTPVSKLFGAPRLSPGGMDYAADIERGNPSSGPTRLGSRLEHWLQADCPGTEPRGAAIIVGGAKHIGVESTWNKQESCHG
jgi:hypothetical protein